MAKSLALITGASRGIGNSLACAFAEDGFNIVAVARDGEKLEQLAEKLKHEHGTKVIPITVDITDNIVTATQIEAVLSKEMRLDVLIHCAGIFRFGTGDLSLADFDLMYRTNTMAAHNITKISLPYLRQAKKAHIFAVASIAGMEPFAPVGGYAASKHALVGYTRSIARQEILNGIRTTVICPDVVNTEMASGSGMTPEQMIESEDIVRAARFAMSLSDAATLETITIGCRPVHGGIRHQL